MTIPCVIILLKMITQGIVIDTVSENSVMDADRFQADYARGGRGAWVQIHSGKQ